MCNYGIHAFPTFFHRVLMHTQFRLLQQEARDKGKPRHSISK